MRVALYLNCCGFSAAVTLHYISTFLNLMKFSVMGDTSLFVFRKAMLWSGSQISEEPSPWLRGWCRLVLTTLPALASCAIPASPASLGLSPMLRPTPPWSPLTLGAVISLTAFSHSWEKAACPASSFWMWSSCFRAKCGQGVCLPGQAS